VAAGGLARANFRLIASPILLMAARTFEAARSGPKGRSVGFERIDPIEEPKVLARGGLDVAARGGHERVRSVPVGVAFFGCDPGFQNKLYTTYVVLLAKPFQLLIARKGGDPLKRPSWRKPEKMPPIGGDFEATCMCWRSTVRQAGARAFDSADRYPWY
jgi:hypothetical protein